MLNKVLMRLVVAEIFNVDSLMLNKALIRLVVAEIKH
jgi:hypothetical protein